MFKSFLYLITITLAFAVQKSNSLVLQNIHVVDVETGIILKNQNIFIKNGTIQRIDTKKNVFDRSYTIVDCTGKYAIPGLIDSHVHATAGPPERMKQILTMALKGGVTTIRDMGGDGIVLKQWQESQESLLIPRILMSAIFAGDSWIDNDPRAKGSSHNTKPGTTAWLRSITSPTSIKTGLIAAHNFGIHGIKMYADLSEIEVISITEHAKELGLNVWSHSTIYPIRPSQAVNAGVEVLSHAERLFTEIEDVVAESYHSDRSNRRVYKPSDIDHPRMKALLNQMKQKGTVIDATLLISKIRVEQFGIQNSTLESVYKLTERMNQFGIPVIAGTDRLMSPGQPLPNIHHELELLVKEAKFSELDALRAATVIPAQAFKLRKLGVLKDCFKADIVILDDNPLQSISNTRKIYSVIHQGQIIK